MSEGGGAGMGETDVTMASLGKPGEPCEQCGAPLAADQRYCLECGARRGGPRVDYRSYMAAPAAPEEPAGEAPQPAAEPEGRGKGPSKGERDYAPLAAVGGIAVLGLMLLVGVLIGKGDGGGGSSETPVVIERGAAGEGEGGGEANTSGSGSGSNGGGLTGGGSANASGKKEGKNAKEESASDAGAVEASTQELEELENESGEDAAKNALKLPDKIATPGAPPPIDKSKPPGGGEGGVTIK